MSNSDSQEANTNGSSSPRENYNLPIDYGPSTTYGTPPGPRESQTQGLVVPEVHHSEGRTNGGITLPASKSEKKLYGLKRRTFWILLIVAFIVAAAIAGGVGGGLASKKSDPAPVAISNNSDIQDLNATRTNADSVVVVEPTASPTGGFAVFTITPASPRPNSNFATITWDTTFRIFYQDRDGNIRMLESNVTREQGNFLSYEWSKATLLPFTARNSSAIAVITSVITGHRDVLVFTFTENDFIQEWVWNSLTLQWSSGALSKMNITSNKYSQISAVETYGNVTIRVFYQDTNSRLSGLVFSPISGWSSLTEFTNIGYQKWPLLQNQTSGLAVVNFPASQGQIRVYYQDPSQDLTMLVGTDVDTPSENWNTSTKLESIPSGATLSAIIAPNETTRQLQLFYIQGGTLVADLWDANGSAMFVGAHTITNPYLGSGLKVDGPGLTAVTLSDMVLVITPTTGWFSIWQYTQWNQVWRTVNIPFTHFG